LDLASKIREVPDFPKKGTLFYDITTLLKDAIAFQEAISQMAAPFIDQRIQKVVAIESRGFILGAPVAERLGAGFIPVRKAGKLPADTIEESYTLEYGADRLTMHQDAILKGERVLIIDDLLATGGTAWAASRLVTRLGGEIQGISCLIELAFLKGRERLGDLYVHSVLVYD